MTTPALSAPGATRAFLPLPKGGTSSVRSYRDTVPLSLSTSTSLSENTMKGVEDELNRRGCGPSSSTRRGLLDLAATLKDMAENRLSRRYHLFSLDPGMGKTTMVRHFLDQLVRSPCHDGVSAIVFLYTLKEVEALLRDLQNMGVRDHVGVLVGKREEERFADLLHTAPGEARILITTQQMLTQRCRGTRRFAEVAAFHYRGKARHVRVWDESFMPGEEFSLSSDDLASLLQPAREHCGALATAIEKLREELMQATANKRLHVPDLGVLGGHEATAALCSMAMDPELAEPVRAAARNLLDVVGETPLVCQDSAKDGIKFMLDYRDTIPSDLAPMVILDASGRCRHTYRLMETQRGNLVRHDTVGKDYSNLQIAVWACGGGRSSFAQDSESRRLRGIAQTILLRPHEDWLVIHHKDRKGAESFKTQLSAFLPQEVLSRVSFLHWGNHHGTNDYAQIGNVILVFPT